MYNKDQTSERERELLILLNQGSEPAFAELYKLYSVRILKKLILLLKDEAIAMDVLQDVFMKIWEKRDTLDPEKSFAAFLFQIAENRVTDLFRRAKTNQKLLDHIIHASTELYFQTDDFVNGKESSKVLQQVIDKLPARRKEIFLLCKMEGKSYEEVAQMLQISTGTVNDHMVKALRHIREQLSNHDVVLLTLISSFLYYS